MRLFYSIIQLFLNIIVMFYNLKINLHNLRRNGIYSAINSHGHTMVDIYSRRYVEFINRIGHSRLSDIQSSNDLQLFNYSVILNS